MKTLHCKGYLGLSDLDGGDVGYVCGTTCRQNALNQSNSYKLCFFINSSVSTHWTLARLCSKVLRRNAKQLLLAHLK